MLGTRAPALLVSALWRLVLSASALGDSVLDARCFSVWCSTLGALPSTHAPSVLGARCSTLDARRFDAELGTVTQRLVKLAQLNAQAQGRSIVALVVAGRQLWLSQARVQEPDKAPLLDAPITPGHTFGWAVEDMLQRSAKAHEASQRMARMWPNKPFQLKRPQEHQWRRTLPQQQAHPRGNKTSPSSAPACGQPTFVRPQRGGWRPRGGGRPHPRGSGQAPCDRAQPKQP
ncbi:UNVERIFIED_CONTAM: hypothetical protein FKN15_023635 [Acipenser sinensis]